MKKVLFICSDKYPPNRVDVKILLADQMPRKGYEIHWVMQSDQLNQRPYETIWIGGKAWVGKTVENFGRASRIRQQLYNIINELRSINLVLVNKYDFIQVKDKLFSAVILLSLAKMFKINFFYWLSYPFPEAKLYSFKMGYTNFPIINFFRGKLYSILLYNIVMKFSDHIFAQSEKMKEDLQKKNINKSKITVVPMGFSAEMVNRDKDFENDGKKIVTYVGTIIRERRLDFLVRVAKNVVEKVPETIFYIVGGGENPQDYEFLMNQIKKFSMEINVKMTGWVKREKAIEYIKKSNICVSPYFPTPILQSTSPTKIIEYMALGKPVVANEHPEQKAIIDKSGGGICTAYNEKEFAKAIIKILLDENLEKSIGEKGKKYVFANREYSIIADKLDRKYKDLMFILKKSDKNCHFKKLK